MIWNEQAIHSNLFPSLLEVTTVSTPNFRLSSNVPRLSEVSNWPDEINTRRCTLEALSKLDFVHLKLLALNVIPFINPMVVLYPITLVINVNSQYDACWFKKNARRYKDNMQSIVMNLEAWFESSRCCHWSDLAVLNHGRGCFWFEHFSPP
jgi:hypothetical protein